jgi:phosphoribosylglycinamide formyltransferase 1
MKRIAVFASGNGSNLEALIGSLRPLEINGKISLVFSDNRDAVALKRAKRHGLDCVSFSPKDFSSREEYGRELLKLVEEKEIDFVILAGYMLLLSPEFIRSFKNRVINIHPSLLPSFKGLHGIKDAYEYGVKVTGVSIHFVDEGLDSGPIILQRALDIRESMSLADLEKTIHEIEHEIYPLAVKYLCDGRLLIKGRKVIIG